ncbi:MAG: hypothetical protein ACJA1X_001164, partial [Bermanella sp.]
MPLANFNYWTFKANIRGYFNSKAGEFNPSAVASSLPIL